MVDVRPTVTVVGANGRVGSALVEHLSSSFFVRAVARNPDESMQELVARSAEGSSVVINAAGVAHVSSTDTATLDRLRAANIELPTALGRTALDAGASFIHVSSAKAADPDSSPYAASKRDGDRQLEQDLAPSYEHAGLNLIVVRPLALLFPPLDAGKVSRLRFIRAWPARLTPPVRLPVLAPVVFLRAIEEATWGAIRHTEPPGYVVREFAKPERGTLRDVRAAFRASA